MAEFASHSVGTAGLTTGIIGTALGALNGGLGLLTGMGGMPTIQYVSKESFELAQKNAELQSELSLIKSEQNTEVKLADVYQKVAAQTLALERAENEKWTNQLVWNAKMDSRMAVAENQIGQLMGMTGLYVEASKVTPMPMDRYNSWTAPTT